MINVCVIGGGASGLTAAIAAAREGAKVTLIEQKERLGKKILSTGNGRCNLTNEYMDLSCFRGEDVTFADYALKCFGCQETITFFSELGVLTKSRNGYIYPRSDQALTIVEALEMELKRRKIECLLLTKVNAVKKTKKGFSIHAIQKIEVTSEKNAKKKKKPEYIEKEQLLYADKIILATGGKAASVLGSDGSGYNLVKSLGHSLNPVVPALVQLKSEDTCFKQLAGIRTEGTVHLFVNDKEVCSDTGEIQLTDYGISGIPVFQVSRYAALGLYNKDLVKAVLDFLPAITKDEYYTLLKNRRDSWKDNTLEDCLSGIFNKKMIPVLLRKANLNSDMKVKEISDEQFFNLVHTCKNFEVEIAGTNSFDQAQVCAGGVKTSEVSHVTMESKLVKNLYLTGELLDIEGICGGYNLQWAWATGILAGKAAANS